MGRNRWRGCGAGCTVRKRPTGRWCVECECDHFEHTIEEIDAFEQAHPVKQVDDDGETIGSLRSTAVVHGRVRYGTFALIAAGVVDVTCAGSRRYVAGEVEEDRVAAHEHTHPFQGREAFRNTPGGR